jgi:hypothetical protein
MKITIGSTQTFASREILEIMEIVEITLEGHHFHGNHLDLSTASPTKKTNEKTRLRLRFTLAAVSFSSTRAASMT